jgi:eukaryotic-like serine/threonine-protein kinase
MPVQSKGALLAGRYRVLGPLGSGGMATVLLCEDERLGRRVAIKRLHAHSPDDIARRFTREARVGASLNHPNLVSVYDTVTDDESVLIVMELVDGETLRDALRRGPLPTQQALAILRDVATALDHAHSHGVTHRDVKPANVLLRPDGVAKLADMGIAVAADSTRITHSGTVLGSAPYMSHEQLEGQKAGPPADVYSLAVVAFEALTGRKARDGSTPLEIARQVANQPPPDLTEALPGAPKAAAAALKRAMDRDPDKRQLSAGRLMDDLEGAFAKKAEPVRAEPRPAKVAAAAAPRPRRSRSRMPALAALLALLLVAAGAVALSLSGGSDDNAPASKQSAKKPARAKAKKKPSAPAQQPQAQGQPQPQQAQQQPQEQPVAAGGQGGAAEGARLNSQGYALMRQGRYDEAIPVLQRAVRAFPEGSQQTTYAYALYNLGASLRRAGRADEAIPILERRLQFPNQRDVVQRELDLARRDAGR